MVEEVKFMDAESYQGSGDTKLTFRMIVLQHLKKILSLSCVEFRGGFTQIKYTKGGDPIEVYIPDTREIYCNAVDGFADVLAPHFKDDKVMKKVEDQLGKELIIKIEEVAERIKKTEDNGKVQTESKKILRQEYKLVKVKNKRKLFRALNFFLERTKYMEGRVFEEEV